MSFGTLYVGNSGLRAQQFGIDVVANNIANANTVGFKSSRPFFQETLIRTISPPRPEVGGAASVNAKEVGLGVTKAAVQRSFAQGAFTPTGIESDVAIEGEGFFVVQGFDGQPDLLYTRAGNFHVDGQTTGDVIRFANPDGNLLMGLNATVSAVTGLMTLPSSGLGLTPEVLEIDVAAGLPGRMTSTITFRRNLFSLQPLAMDADVLETENQGVDNSFRLEFQRAAATPRNLFFFRATEVAESAPTLVRAPIVDSGGGAIDGQEIEGIVEIDSDGRVVAWYDAGADADGDDFLTEAEVAALSPWSEVATTSVANEAHGTANGTSVPAPFGLGKGVLNAGSVVVRSGAVVLAEGTDYTVDLVSGLVTPLSVWPAGAITADYDYDTPFFTVGQGPVVVAGEVPTDALGAPIVADGVNVPLSFAVAEAPIQVGTLVVNALIGGAPVVEGTDYSVDYTTGTIRPLTVWDAGAITVDYTRADTRERIEFDSRAAATATVVFRSAASGASAVGALKNVQEYREGVAVDVWASNDEAQSLSVRFERLSDNRWMYEAVPTLRETFGSAAVTDTAFDGGASAATVSLGTTGLIAEEGLRDGYYDLTVEVDEGNGFVAWTQIAASAPFVGTGGTTRFFKVVGGATSAPSIAFSRDLAVSSPSFAVRVIRRMAEPVGIGTLEFDSSGALVSAPVVRATALNLALATSPQGVNLDFTGLVQAAAATTVAANSDGFRSGAFVRYEIDDGGRILGFYTNGKTQTLGRLLLARFPNPEGLLAQGQNIFATSINSGTATYGFTGEGGRGLIRPKTVEASNVDLTVELVDLILLQRVYQFNSRVVTTVDTMIQEAIQMKR